MGWEMAVRDSKKSSEYILIIGAGLCAILLLSVFLTSWSNISEEIDPITLCSPDDQPREIVLILLDSTDPLNLTQKRKLKAMMIDQVKTIKVGTLLALGVVRAREESWGRLFYKCKPQTGENANPFRENRDRITAIYDSEFLTPLLREFEKALESDSDSESPIMNALQALISDIPTFEYSDSPKEIIIISDMLHHVRLQGSKVKGEGVPLFSHYRHETWEFYLDNGGIDRLSQNLIDVDISIIRIPRSGDNVPSWEKVKEFWINYFEYQGSNFPVFDRLGDQ